MERDFCIADMYVPRKRGGLDPANLEMALYLRGQLHHIPQDIPKLSDEGAVEAIPDRFTDLKMKQEVQVLDYGLEDDRNSDDDEEDLSWVEGEVTEGSGGAAGGGEDHHSQPGGLGNGGS